MYIFISLGIAGVIYSILALQKRLKEVTRLLLISPRWVNWQGLIPSLLMDYVVLYTNDCSRFCCRWIVFISHFLDDMKHELSLKWVVYVHNHHDLLRCSYF
jgi:hypothetical protein